ncbi:MAG TPA: ABC transporter ATP-binding protein [Planctomycetota bacterium]|nr:ABC transporter ATP-binding protein [Planctomycetota bacterium]
MIGIRGVTKDYGRKTAVNDLTLDIAQGELFAFLGPNGAGKTTTIKMIAGLLRPTRGAITVCGFDVQRDYIEAKRRMAYVPDQPYLYDKLSGFEFLEFIGEMYGLGRDERRKEIERLSELFDMDGYLDLLTESYSHGMKQRVVLAGTLLHKPKVMVVDEPLVGLDPHTARLVKNIFRDQARAGTTIFMSTHVISIAEDVADRVGIILEGRVVALGTVAELRRQANHDGKLEDVFFKITEGQSNGGQ